ncbi:hypothetical protein B0H13DRAFT_935783 [Mycena leptocephala]|nr:hypothetical protein B0H13DRAFT_935783 [Mycena leptocephala]
MQIPFSVLFALVLSLDTFAAPLPNANANDNFALEARAKVVAKKPAAKPAAVKAPVKAKPAVVKAPVAAKPAVVPAKAPVKAAVPAKPPVKAAVPAKAPVKANPVAAKPPTVPAKVPVTAKPPTKVGNGAPAAVKPANGAPAAAKPAASAKPSKLPKCTAAQVEARELEERIFGSITHPDAAGTITLFHGTTAANAAALAAGAVNLALTRGTGDFNHRPGTRRLLSYRQSHRRGAVRVLWNLWAETRFHGRRGVQMDWRRAADFYFPRGDC